MQGYSTPSRKRILEYLEENKSRTVTVADIENYLAKKECAVNKTTIYRFLEKLILENRQHFNILRMDITVNNIFICNAQNVDVYFILNAILWVRLQCIFKGNTVFI